MVDAKKLSNVYFVGRMGEFKFYESDELVRRAFEVVADLVVKKSPNEIDKNSLNSENLEVENNENE